MTLVEMLVSIAVLAVMVLAFSSIMVQSEQFVSLAQSSRRSHALAAAIGRVVRRDLRRISQNGCLAITRASANSTPLLIFTAAGATYSATDANACGTGSLVCYGQCNNQGTGGGILWRAAYVLADNRNQAQEKDVLPFGMTQLQAKTRAQIHTSVVDAIATLHQRASSSLQVPPTTLDRVNDLWQVLATGCSGLSITWTDGRVADADNPNDLNLNWYGIDPSPQAAVNPRRADLEDIEDPNNYGGASYRALWTNENQRNWPRAIKIRFRITNVNLPVDYRGARSMDYEVIANIGR